MTTPINVAARSIWLHERSGALYEVIAVVDKIKLLHWWAPISIVVYRRIERPLGPVFARFRANFVERFSLI
jgi:hypothetical protein